MPRALKKRKWAAPRQFVATYHTPWELYGAIAAQANRYPGDVVFNANHLRMLCQGINNSVRPENAARLARACEFLGIVVTRLDFLYPDESGHWLFAPRRTAAKL